MSWTIGSLQKLRTANIPAKQRETLYTLPANHKFPRHAFEVSIYEWKLKNWNPCTNAQENGLQDKCIHPQMPVCASIACSVAKASPGQSPMPRISMPIFSSTLQLRLSQVESPHLQKETARDQHCTSTLS